MITFLMICLTSKETNFVNIVTEKNDVLLTIIYLNKLDIQCQ